MSYGVDNESQYRQAAIYVDRIFRGGCLAPDPIAPMAKIAAPMGCPINR